MPFSATASNVTARVHLTPTIFPILGLTVPITSPWLISATWISSLLTISKKLSSIYCSSIMGFTLIYLMDLRKTHFCYLLIVFPQKILIEPFASRTAIC